MITKNILPRFLFEVVGRAHSGGRGTDYLTQRVFHQGRNLRDQFYFHVARRREKLTVQETLQYGRALMLFSLQFSVVGAKVGI